MANELESMADHCRGRGYLIDNLAPGRWRVRSPAGTDREFDDDQIRALATTHKWQPPMANEREPAADAIDKKLADLFPEWEGDQRELISKSLVDAAIAALSPVPDDVAGLVERLRTLGAMLVHADALSIKPKAPNEVETTCITTNQSRMLWAALSEAAAALSRLSPAQVRRDALEEARFQIGDQVTKIKGAAWTGRVVGFYSTTLTPIGCAVESENEPGSVQIYPEHALAILNLSDKTP